MGNALDGLMHKANAPGNKKDWHRLIEMGEGDPSMQAMSEEG